MSGSGMEGASADPPLMSMSQQSVPFHSPLGALAEGALEAGVLFIPSPLEARSPPPHPASSNNAARLIANSFCFINILPFSVGAGITRPHIMPGKSLDAGG